MKSILFVVFACLAFSPTPSRAAVDVCSILTVDQVQTATKIKVLPAIPLKSPDEMTGKCRFVRADKGGGEFNVIIFSVYKPERIEVMKNSWAHPQFLKYKPVPGVGDYAYFLENTRVLDAGIGNNKALSIHLLDGPTGDASLEILKTLAREALAKL